MAASKSATERRTNAYYDLNLRRLITIFFVWLGTHYQYRYKRNSLLATVIAMHMFQCRRVYNTLLYASKAGEAYAVKFVDWIMVMTQEGNRAWL
jgi:hypothetical protein